MTSNILRVLFRCMIPVFLVSVINGCQLSDEGTSPHVSDGDYLASFEFKHSSINLSTVAPYDTITLKFNAALGDGNYPSDSIVYTVTNSAIRIIDGVLKADEEVSHALIIAKMKRGLVTRIDTAFVSVISTIPPEISEFKFNVDGSDSAKVATGNMKTIPFFYGTGSEASLGGLHISFKSSDLQIATFEVAGQSLNVTAIRPGRVMLHASTYAYGKELSDSIVFTAGWPLLFHLPVIEKNRSGSVDPILDFMYGDITIGVGGCVVFSNVSQSKKIDVKFENPARVSPAGACSFFLIRDRFTGGDIPPYMRTPVPVEGDPDEVGFDYVFSPYKARTFNESGAFAYQSELNLTKGVVMVCNENTDTTCAPSGLGQWKKSGVK